jgi:hypothetical protein
MELSLKTKADFYHPQNVGEIEKSEGIWTIQNPGRGRALNLFWFRHSLPDHASSTVIRTRFNDLKNLLFLIA